jgi:tripartite-type tricarboxylate transporter receptor subunit TctC
MPTRRTICLGGGASLLGLGIEPGLVNVAAAPSAFPSRTVKIVVPNPPGTLLDVIPRLIADKLSEKWGQPVIIENRPGAAQNIGADAVAKSDPDGYTLLATPPGPLVVSQWYFPKLTFDPTDFVPITVMVGVPTVLVANPGLPVSSFREFVAYARANAGRLNYGSPGPGSTPQLAQEALMQAGDFKMVHVPYQGMGPALKDLIAGHIQVMLDIVGNSLPLIQDGRLKALAATGNVRIPQLPDVPTVAETLPGYVHSEWFALVAPPKTPPELAGKISAAVAEILKRPDVVQRLEAMAATPVGSEPDDAAHFIKGERDRWRRIVAALPPRPN